MDRLDNAEVIEVIRLIRNTANFGNTIFIAAYQKSYIIQALRSKNLYNSEYFLEKIFQYELDLPLYDDTALYKTLVANLEAQIIIREKEYFKMLFSNERRKRIADDYNDLPNFTFGVLESMRDIQRFCNSFLIVYEQVKGEVILNDLLNTELLRFKFPSVYQLIFTRTLDFFQVVPYDVKNHVTFNKAYYIFKKDSEDRSGEIGASTINKKDKISGNETSSLYQYIEKHASYLYVPKNKIYQIFRILKNLLPSYETDHVSTRHFCSPLGLKRYSYYNLLDENISFNEFVNLTEKSTPDPLKNKIDDWIKEKKIDELKFIFEDTNYPETQTQFENIVQGIFHLARTNTHAYPSDYFGYSFDNLYNKLEKENVALLYNRDDEHKGVSLYKEFLSKLLEEAPSPYVFELSYLSYLIEKYYKLTRDVGRELDLWFLNLLGIEYLEYQRIKYIKKYLNSVNSFDQIIKYQIWNCDDHNASQKRFENIRSDIKFTDLEISKLIKQFAIDKDISGFFKMILRTNLQSKGKYFYDPQNHNDIVLRLFESQENFESFLNQLNEEQDPIIREFRTFYKELKKNNFKITFNPFEKYNF